MKRGRTLLSSSRSQADKSNSDSEAPVRKRKPPHSSTSLCKSPETSVNVFSSKSARQSRPSCFVVTQTEMRKFFDILDNDNIVREFLLTDSCRKLADKYLLAMTFAYFKRANYPPSRYTQMNFFIALYLAHDLEEDEEEIKYDIFPWALGKMWQSKYKAFIRKRDQLLKRIQYKAIVSRRCCDEIMQLHPQHAAWQRERQEHHGGATRSYLKEEEGHFVPIGPYNSPPRCRLCRPDDSPGYSSSDSQSLHPWYISDSDESPDSSREEEEQDPTSTSTGVFSDDSDHGSLSTSTASTSTASTFSSSSGTCRRSSCLNLKGLGNVLHHNRCLKLKDSEQ